MPLSRGAALIVVGIVGVVAVAVILGVGLGLSPNAEVGILKFSPLSCSFPASFRLLLYRVLLLQALEEKVEHRVRAGSGKAKGQD